MGWVRSTISSNSNTGILAERGQADQHQGVASEVHIDEDRKSLISSAVGFVPNHLQKDKLLKVAKQQATRSTRKNLLADQEEMFVSFVESTS